MDYICSKHSGFIVRKEGYFYEIYHPEMKILISCNFPDSPNFGFHKILYVSYYNQNTLTNHSCQWKFTEKTISSLYDSFFKNKLISWQGKLPTQ